MNLTSLHKRISYYRAELRKWAAPIHLRAVAFLLGMRPLPLNYWKIARWFARCISPIKDALLPNYWKPLGTGAMLKDPCLREALNNDELGFWTLDPKTLDFIWSRLLLNRPQTIIEFGAGVSSVALAKYAQTLRERCGVTVRVVSLEQTGDICIKIQERLAKTGLSDDISVLHAPLSVENAYQFDKKLVWIATHAKLADCVIIDGPSGPPGCRLSTLPSIIEFCRHGTRWFLDDALRDGELAVLSEWSKHPGIVVEGIYPIGKGLATGVITSEGSAPL